MRPATWRPPSLSRSRTTPSAGSSWSNGEPGREQGGRATRQPCGQPCGSCADSLFLASARVADLQTEVESLRGHKDKCERANLSLLQELRQVRAHVQLQDSELRKLQQELQQAAWAPEKEAPEVRPHRPGGSSSHPQARLPCSWVLGQLFPGPSTQLRPCYPGREGPRPALSPHPPPHSFPGPSTRTRCRPWTRGIPTRVAQAFTGGKGLWESRGWFQTHRVFLPLLVVLFR